MTRESATSDPAGFIADLPERVILDEVQRVPALFTSMKASVDRDRRPGRFLLTGSANVLLIPKLADSLAGRMELLRLHPLAQCELAHTRSGFLDALFSGRFKARSFERLGRELASRIVAGGYPAALARSTSKRRAVWYRDYLTLLERIFLVETLPPWHSNRTSRLIKTPKLHLGDTGVACALLGLDAQSLKEDRVILGQLLETFVFQELRRQASWLEDDVRFHHFRDKDGAEADLVLELGGRALAGIEIKAAATVTAADFRGLAKLRAAAAKRFAIGVVLYDGEASLTFGDRMYAVPIRGLWEIE